MQEKETSLNVETIMAEIRDKLKDQDSMEDIPPFEAVPIRGEAEVFMPGKGQEISGLKSSLKEVQNSYHIPYYFDLGPKGLKTFVNKLVRRLNKSLLTPMLERLNTFHKAVVRHLTRLSSAVEMLFAADKQQKQELEQLRAELNARADQLQIQMDQLQKQYMQICCKGDSGDGAPVEESGEAMPREETPVTSYAQEDVQTLSPE